MNILDEFEKISKEQTLIKYQKHKVESVYDDIVLQKLLCEQGIPRMLSPMLNFMRDEKGGFDKINEYGEYGKGLEDMGINSEKSTMLANYNNCLIFIDESKSIRMIDYDNSEIRYINKDIVAFFKCVICFNSFITEIIEQNPECDYIEDCITEEDLEEIEGRLAEIDEDALEENALWCEAIEQLLE